MAVIGRCFLIMLLVLAMPAASAAKDITLPEAGISLSVPDSWQVLADAKDGTFEKELFQKLFFFRGVKNQNRLIAVGDPEKSIGIIVLNAEPNANFIAVVNAAARVDEQEFQKEFAATFTQIFQSKYDKESKARGFTAKDFTMTRKALAEDTVVSILDGILQNGDGPEVIASNVMFMEKRPGTLIDTVRVRGDKEQETVINSILDSIRLIPRQGE